MKRVLLYSGGMDSWLIDKLWKPDKKIFFDIGTANSNFELDRVKKERDVQIVKLSLFQFEEPKNNYYLPLRNLHFVVYAAHFGDVICLGATGSSTHKDKTDTFAILSENVINYLLSEKSSTSNVKIVMPYRNKSKTEILAEYLSLGGDIDRCFEETFSCYNPDSMGNPCMHCVSCLSKFTAFYNNGYHFDGVTIDRFIEGALSQRCKSDSRDLAVKLKYGNKTICIDFDNTITTDSKYPVTGSLRDGCKEYLEYFKHRGYKLVLFTSRVGIDFIRAVEFCKDNKLPFDDFIEGKPYAKFYVDDKAVSFDYLMKEC